MQFPLPPIVRPNVLIGIGVETGFFSSGAVKFQVSAPARAPAKSHADMQHSWRPLPGQVRNSSAGEPADVGIAHQAVDPGLPGFKRAVQRGNGLLFQVEVLFANVVVQIEDQWLGGFESIVQELTSLQLHTFFVGIVGLQVDRNRFFPSLTQIVGNRYSWILALIPDDKVEKVLVVTK